MRPRRARVCHVCKEKYKPHSSLQKACTPKCALEYHKRVQEKAFKKAKGKYNRETKQRKEALKTRSQWTKEAQKEFNRFIRLRDHDKPCISCGKSPGEVEESQGWKPGGAWDCGHFLSVGSHPELRFNELNAHRQCKACNSGSYHHAKKGHTVSQSYRESLVDRIGLSLVEWLEGPHEALKPTIDELKWLKDHYRDKCKELG